MRFDSSTWSGALERQLRIIHPPEMLDDVLGPAVAPALTARALAVEATGHARSGELDAIHSELQEQERLFLMGWFSNRWDGVGDIVEVGPFLGSSTRAISLGMLANERRRATARLVTYDRFEDYYRGAALDRLVGTLPQEMVDDIARTGSFYDAFVWLHSREEYWPIVDARIAALRSGPDDPLPADRCFRLDAGPPLGALFVDGAKSWFGTKDLVLASCGRLAPGTTVIFQDFGHYTCYWLPAFVAVLQRKFRLVANVADTYAFEVVEEITADDIVKRFPDRPQDWPREVVDAVFEQRQILAVEHSDTYGLLSAKLQYAAALADRGDVDDAVRLVDSLLVDPAWAGRRDKIIAARRSPTYRPDGEVLLPAPTAAVTAGIA